MASMNEVRQSIKALAETQEKGQKIINKALKELSESRREASESWNKFQKEMSKSRKKSSESWNKFQKEMSDIRKESQKEIVESRKSRESFQKEMSESRKKSSESWNKFQKEMSESRKKSSESWNKFQKEMSDIRKESQKEIVESRKSRESFQKEMSESRKKSSESWNKFQKEMSDIRKESDRRTNKILGEWSHQWGKFIEKLVDSGVISLLEQRGIKVTESATRVRDRRPNCRWEIDIIAVNGKEIVAIEVKKKLKKQDVKEAIEDFKMFQQDSRQCRGKILYGAVAYLECEPQVEKYAERLGLFVFQATGNSAKLINKPDFKPQAFPLSIVFK